MKIRSTSIAVSLLEKLADEVDEGIVRRIANLGVGLCVFEHGVQQKAHSQCDRTEGLVYYLQDTCEHGFSLTEGLNFGLHLSAFVFLLLLWQLRIVNSLPLLSGSRVHYKS